MGPTSTVILNLRTLVCRQAQSPSPASTPCYRCSLMFDTSEQPFRGGQCDVYAVTDHTGQSICFRIYRDPGPSSIYLLKKEIEYRKEIEKNKIRNFQKVMNYSTDLDNLIGSPYLSLSWAFGQPLKWSDTSPATCADRERVIAAVAQSTMDLLNIQRTGVSSFHLSVTDSNSFKI